MSGASKEYDSKEENQRVLVQQKNAEIAARFARAGKSGVPVDAETLAAEREDRQRRAFIPPARIAAPSAAFNVKSVSQIKAEAEAARLALVASSGVKIRSCANDSDVTETEKKAQFGKPPKPAKPAKGEKPPKAEKAAKTEAVKAPPAPLTFSDFSSHVAAYREREANFAASLAASYAALAKEEEKLISYSFDLPGKSGTFQATCKPSEFAPIAVNLCREGSRKVKPSMGSVLTLIHTRTEIDPVSGRVRKVEYCVGRKLAKDSEKAHAAGAKALAEGLPRSKSCPDCKGMGRRYDYRSGNVVCETCKRTCGEKCPGAKCVKCRGEGVYGAGNVPGEPLPVHAYTVTAEILRTYPVGTDSNGETIDRGVIALDRPLPGQPVIPSRKGGAITTGGKPPSGEWQARAKTTRVTFSGG